MFACYPGGLSEEEPTAGDDLLRQIWEVPDDPARLAVYADWLLEHDDATRGEYIHLSQLASPTPEQLARRDAVFRRNRTRWIGIARHYIHTWEDCPETPSFPSRVACNADQLVAGFELIRDLGPKITVIVEHSTHRDEILPTLPLGQLFGLGLAGVTNRLFARLEPALQGIQRLELTRVDWSLSPERLLAELDHLETLVELELRCFDTSDPYLRALATGPHAERLRVLVIDEPADASLRAVAARAFGDRLTLVPRR